MMHFCQNFLKRSSTAEDGVDSIKVLAALLSRHFSRMPGKPDSLVAARADGAAVGWIVMAAAQVVKFYCHCSLSRLWCSANFYRVQQQNTEFLEDSQNLGMCMCSIKSKAVPECKNTYTYSKSWIHLLGDYITILLLSHRSCYVY